MELTEALSWRGSKGITPLIAAARKQAVLVNLVSAIRIAPIRIALQYVHASIQHHNLLVIAHGFKPLEFF